MNNFDKNVLYVLDTKCPLQASVFEHFISNSEELIWRMGKV